MFKNKTFEGDNIPKATKWLYLSSAMFRDLAYQFVSMFLLMFAQYCGLGGESDYSQYLAMYGVISLVIILLRLWDGVNDPIMGFILEKSRLRKFGKYRPWIFIGAIGSSIMTMLMFWLPVHGWAYVACFAIFYFFWDLTYTMNDIAYWSVLPSLSHHEKVRSQLTTIISIFVSIGAFAAGGLVPILSSALGYTVSYRMFSLVCSVLYLVSQVVLCIFMKERKEDEDQVKASENMKLREIFTVLGKNDQVRSSIIGVLLYYTGSSILVTLGLNYFYFNFGYSDAGTYQFYFTIVYAAATLLAQFSFQFIMNKLKWTMKKLMTISGIVVGIGYLGLFFYVFLDPFAFFPLMAVLGFIVFFFQTFFQLIIYINIQDSIEYNEFKFGERRESAVFSLRALAAKLGSSIQQGVLYLALLIGGLLTISNSVSGFEQEAIVQFNGDVAQISEYVKEHADAITGTANVELWQRVVYQIGFTIVPMLFMVGCCIYLGATFRINEKSHEDMVKEIALRKAENVKEEVQE